MTDTATLTPATTPIATIMLPVYAGTATINPDFRTATLDLTVQAPSDATPAIIEAIITGLGGTTPSELDRLVRTGNADDLYHHELPTEPGVYADVDGDVWSHTVDPSTWKLRLDADGSKLKHESVDPAACLPMRRIRPAIDPMAVD